MDGGAAAAAGAAPKRRTKYVAVTGGVVSGLGKGITISSIGRLLKQSGLRVTAIKIDPYLNTDAGTMSPFEHGEVFVLNDGGEVRGVAWRGVAWRGVAWQPLLIGWYGGAGILHTRRAARDSHTRTNHTRTCRWTWTWATTSASCP
jgi:hypothetical protein